MGESEITCRDFWDAPRIFVVRHQGQLYLFDCRFNESVEDFEQMYRVYTSPDLPESESDGSWKGLAERGVGYLGEVPVGSVTFGESRRRRIDTRIIDELKDNVGGGAFAHGRT